MSWVVVKHRDFFEADGALWCTPRSTLKPPPGAFGAFSYQTGGAGFHGSIARFGAARSGRRVAAGGVEQIGVAVATNSNGGTPQRPASGWSVIGFDEARSTLPPGPAEIARPGSRKQYPRTATAFHNCTTYVTFLNVGVASRLPDAHRLDLPKVASQRWQFLLSWCIRAPPRCRGAAGTYP
jgi:hypothetical protein